MENAAAPRPRTIELADRTLGIGMIDRDTSAGSSSARYHTIPVRTKATTATVMARTQVSSPAKSRQAAKKYGAPVGRCV